MTRSDPLEGRIERHHTDVVHRPHIGGHGQPVLVASLKPGSSAGDHVLDLPCCELKSFDRDRALDRSRSHLPTQGADPWGRIGRFASKLAPQLIQLAEASLLTSRESRCAVDHTVIIRLIV